MALIDDPEKWILRLFEMEEREGRGQDCRRFPEGKSSPELPLVEDEKIYGTYRDTYYFTPFAVLIRNPDAVRRIPWNSIRSCSTRHGDGKKVSTLTFVDGSKLEVLVSELATGWSGRISQLFHQMIERFGSRATVGLNVVSIDDFFRIATDDYSLFPNLEPHLPLESIRRALDELRARSDVEDVLLADVSDDDSPIINALLIRTSAEKSAFTEFASSLGSDGVMDAAETELRVFSDLNAGEHVWHIVWD